MTAYRIKRTNDGINHYGLQIVGPVTDVGVLLPGATVQPLDFNQSGTTVAIANLEANEWYEVSWRVYGDIAAKLELTTKPVGDPDEYKTFMSLTIPEDAPETVVGHAYSSSKLAKVEG